MAIRMLRATQNLSNLFRNLSVSPAFAKNALKYGQSNCNLLQIQAPATDCVRSISFLNKITGSELWKGCTTVSNAGKKRGRAKLAGKGLTKDLNRGQFIGKGRKNIVFPGLNAPVIRGKELVENEKVSDDPEWSEKLYRLRDMNRKTRRFHKVSHLERGYSGSRLAGRSIGAPDPIGSYEFQGFDTRCIEMKIVNTMRGNLGRSRRHSTFAVTGNGNGIAGFAMGKSSDPKAAIRKAKNRAGQKLMHIQLCEGHTIYHDFFTQFGPTKIYAYKMPEGFGIRAHRIIKTICQLVGIKNLRAKIEGGTSPQSICKAFFVGLLQQKTYAQIAEEKKLFLVEFNANTSFFPKIVGVPSYCRTASEIPKDEILDFNQYCFSGKVVLKKQKRPPMHRQLPSYQIHLKKSEKRRSHDQIKFDMRTRYGELRSFLADKYPEARNVKHRYAVADKQN